MNIALIGMSGAGKSYWSKKIENFGFHRYSCDDLIAEKLGLKLGKKIGSTKDLAYWMGKPFSKGYHEAESLYLKLEYEVMNFICDELENYILKGEPVIVDTTGSLIYLSNDLLSRLRRLVRTVHLNLPIEKYQEFFETYLLEPKPMIWQGKYIQKKNENEEISLRRCYKELFTFRKKHYNLISDCELEYSIHHRSNTGVKEFLDIVNKRIR